MQQLIPKVTLLLFFVATIANAQTDKNELYDKVKSKFAGLKTLFVKYETLSGTKGSIKVKRAGKYVMNLGETIIYCNGKTNWNMNQTQRRVTIDNVMKGSENSMVEDLFFTVIGNSTPTVITKSNGKSEYQIDLALSQEAAKKVQNIKNIQIFCDEAGNISKLKFKYANRIEELRIQNITYNPPLKDNVFDLTPPQGFQVVDLR